MFEKYNHGIGLEIGDGLVKAMYILSNSRENKLAGFEIQQVNFREGRQGIINAIKDVMGRLPVKKGMIQINISVSGESVVVRDLHWPQMSDEELRKALKFEVERQVHYKTDDIVFDYYSVLDKSITETKTRVILVAAKKELIENYIGLVSSAGYECGFVEVDTFSLLNCFYLNNPNLTSDRTIAVVNVGLEVTNIDIIRGRIVGLTKDAFVAWSNLIDALPENVELDFNNLNALKGLLGSDEIYELCLFILNAVSNQVRRTVEFYESQGRDTVEEIFLTGRLTMYKNLDKYLHGILGLKVAVWDPIARLQYDHKVFEKKKLKENSLMLAVCTGLACHRAFEINLSSKKRAVKKGNRLLQTVLQHQKPIFASVLSIFFLLSLWVILLSQVKAKIEEKNKLVKNNRELAKVLEEIEFLKKGRQALDERMQITRALLSRRVSWSKKLYQISASLPGNLWLTEVSLKELSNRDIQMKMPERIFERIPLIIEKIWKKNVLSIKGMAYSENSDKMFFAVNNFMNNLKNNRDFTDNFDKIELIRSYLDVIDAVTIMKFETECSKQGDGYENAGKR